MTRKHDDWIQVRDRIRIPVLVGLTLHTANEDDVVSCSLKVLSRLGTKQSKAARACSKEGWSSAELQEAGLGGREGCRGIKVNLAASFCLSTLETLYSGLI